MNYKNLKSSGFTLIELLVVIAIIGILAGLVMSNFSGIRQRTRDAQRKADMRQIQSALELYRSDRGSYPPAQRVHGSYDAVGTCGGSLAANGVTYMSKIPCDPLHTTALPMPYYYVASGSPPTGYQIVTCLENLNDQQKDAVNGCGGNGWSYTLTPQ